MVLPMEAKDHTESPEPNREPTHQEVEAQLQRVVGSADFDATARTQRFLRFLVGQVLAGNSAEISQYAIATHAFDRGANFDPSEDPIVRIQAGRLRRSLEHYYLTAGSSDPVRISVPKGSYVPTFHYRQSGRSPEHLDAPAASFDDVYEEAGSWPAVLISPFQNLTGNPDHDYLGQGLATELGIELDRYQIVRIYMHSPALENTGPATPDSPDTKTEFRIEGSIETRGASLGILIRMLHTSDGGQIWGRKFRCDRDDPALSTFLDEVSQSVAAALADERGIIIRHLLRDGGTRPPVPGNSYDALMRFYHFNVSPSPEGFREVVASLREAVKSEPDRGLLWSLLARVIAVNYSLEMGPDSSSIDDAYAYARTGVRLEPDNQRTRAILAYVHLLRDELDAGRREAEAALTLNPNSFCFVDVIGYLLTLLGDWERGTALTGKAIRLNPFHQSSIHFARWLNHLRLEEYAQAHQEAIAVGTNGGFWAPLARASALGHLGHLAEGRAEIAELLAFKPDFHGHWHWLITRYVKFDDLVDRIVTGLRKVGLALDDS